MFCNTRKLNFKFSSAAWKRKTKTKKKDKYSIERSAPIRRRAGAQAALESTLYDITLDLPL